MVEGARLESVYAGNRIEGSNPFLSANNPYKYLIIRYLYGLFFVWSRNSISPKYPTSLLYSLGILGIYCFLTACKNVFDKASVGWEGKGGYEYYYSS